MNIRESMRKNLEDLAEFLHETAALDVSQLGSEWEARKVAIERHAVYLQTFTIPDVPDPVHDLLTGNTSRGINFTPPQRNGAALYAGPMEGETQP